MRPDHGRLVILLALACSNIYKAVIPTSSDMHEDDDGEQFN